MLRPAGISEIAGRICANLIVAAFAFIMILAEAHAAPVLVV
jgi:hypothetical protein